MARHHQQEVLHQDLQLQLDFPHHQVLDHDLQLDCPHHQEVLERDLLTNLHHETIELAVANLDSTPNDPSAGLGFCPSLLVGELLQVGRLSTPAAWAHM